MENEAVLLKDEQKHPVDLQLEWVLGKMPQKVTF